MNLIAFLLLIPAIAAYSIGQLVQHGKIRWSKDVFGFWGEESDRRKYHRKPRTPDGGYWITGAKVNWYTRLFKIKYAERWPTSTNLTVFLTDGYHLMQFFMFIFLSLSITFAIGFDWWLLAGVWSGIHLVHFGVYKLLQK